MIYSFTLQKEIEKWWRKLDKIMSVAESTEPFENIKGEIVYPILDVYIDICNGRKYISYNKVRCHCSC